MKTGKLVITGALGAIGLAFAGSGAIAQNAPYNASNRIAQNAPYTTPNGTAQKEPPYNNSNAVAQNQKDPQYKAYGSAHKGTVVAQNKAHKAKPAPKQ